jgi:hypothetical protein
MKSLSRRIVRQSFATLNDKPSCVMRRSSFCSSDFRLFDGLTEHTAQSEAKSREADLSMCSNLSVNQEDAELKDSV